jgi:hypothetical protein
MKEESRSGYILDKRGKGGRAGGEIRDYISKCIKRLLFLSKDLEMN